jgi:hypothetical protein
VVKRLSLALCGGLHLSISNGISLISMTSKFQVWLLHFSETAVDNCLYDPLHTQGLTVKAAMTSSMASLYLPVTLGKRSLKSLLLIIRCFYHSGICYQWFRGNEKSDVAFLWENPPNPVFRLSVCCFASCICWFLRDKNNRYAET